LYDEEFESLSEMYEAVHVVLRGRIAGAYIGQEIIDEDGPPIPLAFISITTGEILKGIPASVTAGQVEVRLWPAGSNWDEIRNDLPDEEYLFFLYNDAEHRSDHDLPSDDAELEATTYFRPNDQAVIRELDGVVSTFEYFAAACQYGMDRFPLGLEGAAFEEVVQQVRELSR